MKLTLIRHSKPEIDPDTSMTLWGLSNEGIKLAKNLSHNDAIMNLDYIHSSLETKALETMLYLAKPNTIPMRTRRGLNEVTSFSNKLFTGEQYLMQKEKYYTRELPRIAGGETIDEALERFANTLDEITRECNESNIGILSHGTILALFSAEYSGVDPLALHLTIIQPDFAVFDWNIKQFTKFWSLN